MPDASFLDWPFFDDTHRDHVRDLAAWSERCVPSLVAEEHRAGHDHDALDATLRSFVAAYGRAGFLRACAPAEVGGLHRGRLDVRTLCLTRDLLARYSGLADFAFAMQGLGTGPISLFGTAEQQQHFLPPVITGEHVAAFAISEAEAGSDPGTMSMTARRDGDTWILDGEKTWISNAGAADLYTVFARSGEGPGPKGITAFIVPASTPGLAVVERIAVTAPHPLGTLRFTDCRIPDSQRIGDAGSGFKVAMATLDVFRSTVGAAALGFSRRAFDEALDYTENRTIGGQPLADYQMTQERLADMALAIDSSALLIARAAWTKDTTGARITREASMAKLHATESASILVDKAVQMFGGRGVVLDSIVERLDREVRALRIYEGASEVHKIILANQARTARRKEREAAAGGTA